DHVESGFELQILDTHGKKNPGHHDGGGVIRTKGPSKNMMKPAGEWNRYTITLVGSQLKVILNGEQIQDLDISRTEMRDRPLTGYISFQDEAKRIWYRNVKIKEIPAKKKPELEAVPADLAEKFKVPENFKVTSFADNSLINNPLSLAIDSNNQVYLAEVWRFQRGVEDTRQHNYWMEDEVRIMNLTDKLALFTKWTDAGKFKPGHFTEFSDRVMKLHDDDGDGVCEKVTEFAGGFNDALDGIGSSILFDEDNYLYYTNIPHVWKLKDKDGDGVAEHREKLVSGFGLRMGVSGHDLHGLAWGGDGRLYFSNGDRGYDVVSKEGKKFYSASEGAVFRCEPDGSNLELYTTGNRNPQDLEFDQYGNLYTVDNNRGNGDRSRLCYLVEGGHYGWSSGYENLTQFRRALKINERKGPRYDDPWINEGTWRPPFEGQPYFCIPSLLHIDGGSAGLLFNSGESLGEKYKDTFIFTACTRGVYSFRTDREGAGVKATRLHSIWEGGYLVDAELSPDGTLYIADYVTTNNTPKGKGKGNIYTVVDEQARKKDSVIQASKVLSADVKEYKLDHLVSLLGHVDRRVRLKAQFEIVRRGEMKSLAKIAHDTKQSLLPRLHAIWGLGQLSRKNIVFNEVLWSLLQDSKNEVVCQAVKVIGETSDPKSYDKLLALVDHPSERVISFLAPALGKCGGGKSQEVLSVLARENKKQDPFLRNAIVTGMHYAGDVETLVSLAKDDSEALRLHALLALLRTEDPRCVVYLNDPSEMVQHAAVRGITRHNLEKAIPALAEYANVYAQGSTTSSEQIIARSIQANFRIGDMASARRILAMALNIELPMKVRLICLYELTRWEEQKTIQPVDPVVGLIRSTSKDRASSKTLVLEVLGKMSKETHKDLDFHLVTLASQYGLEVDNNRLAALALDRGNSVPDRLKYYQAINDKVIRGGVREKFLDEKQSAFVETALSEMMKLSPKKALEYSLKRVETGTNLRGVYAVLGALKDPVSLKAILLGAKKLSTKSHEDVSVLDLITALENRPEKQAKQALLNHNNSYTKEDALGVYRHTLAGGEVRVGKDLVNSGKGQCVICHNFGWRGIKKVGPHLAGVGKKKRATGEYLIRSLIEPSAFVVQGYGDAKVSAMPDMKLLLTKGEMRDIVAYLKTLKMRGH
ncbi:MAG: quinoprotein glucose dehydrogenase, partial [Cryomorphaceae bacterium]